MPACANALTRVCAIFLLRYDNAKMKQKVGHGEREYVSKRLIIKNCDFTRRLTCKITIAATAIYNYYCCYCYRCCETKFMYDQLCIHKINLDINKGLARSDFLFSISAPE